MNPIHEIKNRTGAMGHVVDLAKLSYVGHPQYPRRDSAYFNVVTDGERSVIESGGQKELEEHRTELIAAWQAYRAKTNPSTAMHVRHRIEKGDNHALIDLHEVLYVGAVMELTDNKYGFPIILRSTGQAINVSFDRESEASKAHVALDNAYGDYLNQLNEQGV